MIKLSPNKSKIKENINKKWRRKSEFQRHEMERYKKHQ